ncbi:pantoate--beta-alanine ligase [Clostridium massiliodielmoense]|uniref:pantoate--beta-alanine ligase n=1 Tax=Clostridium massiliodielmoense TaxID=1776385 RepID=UPI000166855E|nr:pantoate--beta-alanine ligase [Clostridium massiliodielmoense]EDS76586.1 pantoate--beta-alanine ligase [Clostridium botulinum C str. Eklund]KEH97077.1 pantoate--beta-alanine ligase [Clostridium botulinum C/D str. BKT12695]NEZ48693.1 pantoate--beta-alanine ligase [Clostridium botulinum]
MLKLNKINEVKKYVAEWKKEGLTIGLVPTMGCLHEGHKSLIDRAVKENDRVIVSVFVNPTQFGQNEDFDKYPRSIENDVDLCNKAGVSVVFNPGPKEMYFDDACTYVNVENLTDGLCGAKREGHFRGVCTVVSKLFNISQATRAYFGEKDAQQLAVIRRMVRDLNFNIKIVGCPIVRERDGLAKSSRNKYLSKEERLDALVLSNGLKKGKELLESGIREASKIKELIENEISKSALSKIDYVEIVDSVTLKAVENIDRDVLVAIAVFVGKTRLIDNFTFKLGE